MSTRIWILGASDPEMESIETLLCERGERVAYAMAGGRRVYASDAYSGTACRYATDCGRVGEPAETWYLVECQVPVPDGASVVRIDHHRPGDPGYGRPPSEFAAASSLGQVVAALGHSDVRHRAMSPEHLLMAAADHCLAAAYRGECPGVEPDELMRWRVRSRAAFQRRPEEAVLADVERAMDALRAAPRLRISAGVDVADMRRNIPIAELPEAAARLDMAYMSGPLRGPDGRAKYTAAGEPTTVEAWMSWADSHGLVDLYGDPARGFAGGYAVDDIVGGD